MLELSVSAYHKVIPLFEGVDHNVPIIFSVIEKNTPAKIFVDKNDKPESVFLYPENSFFYVTGNEKNIEFNKRLYEMLFGDILVNTNENELILFSSSEEWKRTLDVLLEEKGAIRIQRNIFEFNEAKFISKKIDIKEKLPNGFILKKIDEQVARKIEVVKSWNSVEDFLNKGIGYCIIKDEEIISTCYSIYKGKGEADETYY